MYKLLLFLLLITITPVQANNKVIYKTYHYGIHYPVQIITFVYHAPVLILRYADKKMDEHLALKAGVK